MKHFLAALSALTIALAPVTSLAQTNPQFNAKPSTAPQGLVSCFDYYHFNSVRADVQSSLQSAAQGAMVHFTGTVTNPNAYPIPDATVWGKLMRPRIAGKDVNGPDVLAWMKLGSNFSIPANASVPISFDVTIPVDAQPGGYQLATYVTNLDRFELSGLTFTDDITGTLAKFQVVGQDNGAVRFNKSSVTVNDSPFYFASFPPYVPERAPIVPVNVSLANTTNQGFKGKVLWKLYYWDAITTAYSGGTLLSQKTEDVKIQPHASTSLMYMAADTTHTVYYLVGELQDEKGTTKSIIGVRYVRPEVQLPRFNFLTIAPAKNGGGEVAVACFHSTNTTPVQGGEVQLTARKGGILSDLFGWAGVGKVKGASYKGTIVPDIYALVAPLPAASSYVVTAKLYQNGHIVDQLTVPYCTSNNCSDSRTVLWVTIVAIIVVLLGLLTLTRLHRRKPSSNPSSV